MRVSDLMTPAPQTITATETLAVARERMERGRFRLLPVVDAEGRLVGERIGGCPVVDRSGALVGMITETDVLRGMVLGERRGARLDVLCLVPTQSLAELIDVIEHEGGSVVSTRRETRDDGVRAYRLRLAQEDPARFVDALRDRGYRIRDTQSGRASS